MGTYIKTNPIVHVNGLPLWKKMDSNHFLFFENGYWYAHDAYHSIDTATLRASALPSAVCPVDIVWSAKSGSSWEDASDLSIECSDLSSNYALFTPCLLYN